jgi:polysaccharide biosynthesis transport protein
MTNPGDASKYSDPDEEVQGIFKRLSLGSMFHVLWLKKWQWLAVWVVLAIPAGGLLSIFDLPRSYSAITVLRFPNVIGAQTNVMRDVAITTRESIVSIFKSYSVLEATATRMKLRLRIRSKDTFSSFYFKSIDFTDRVGLGTYTLYLQSGRKAKVVFSPKRSREEYTLFDGAIPGNNRIVAEGLTLELLPKAAERWGNKQIEMEFSGLEETIDALRENLSLRPFGASNFEVTLKDRDPWLVADVLNALREEFLRIYYGTTEVQEVGVLAQMEKDLESAKDKLSRSQDDLSKFYSEHPELAAQTSTMPADNLALLEARSELTLLQGRLDRIKATKAAKPSDSETDQKLFWANELLSAMIEAGEPKASILRAGLQEARAREVGLVGQVGPEHPRLVEAKQKQVALYAEIESIEAGLTSRLMAQKSELQSKMARLASSAGHRPSVKVELELNRLTAVNDNNQAIYDRVLEAYNRAKLVTGSEFFKVAVVDEARPALYVPPSFRTRLVIASASVLALLVLVPFLFLGWWILFPRIWSKDDVTRQLGVKMLGVIVYRAMTPQLRKESEKAGPGDPRLLFYGKGHQLEDIEAFRLVREEAEDTFRNLKRPGKYCIMVTSSRPNEGKSTSAANLAMTFARKGKRTLLVDADLRLGRVADIFGLQVETGLDDILNQTDLSVSEFTEIALMAYLPTMQRDLVVAPRRQPNANAGELVSSDRFKSFLALAREQFDVVIIDTPPVMITPEPLSLLDLVDGVVFVCFSGATVASEALEAVGILKERRVRIAAILNGIKSSPFQANRYKKYTYYYQAAPPTEGQRVAPP